ncbi:MAG: 5'/3'-nucleotidase SurE [Anaerolineales bacterium]|jgi:5'-nucleotidase|nr:5'/3'-nucleotidase SurE [Anaerolineales bacterium]GER78552.1 5'/3'-nucleotidase SurE [Candidatus Denitrolinea symbiosum]
MKKPQILLTNDDGIQSPGLWAAAEALSALGYVTVAAPREQSSGMGRSLPSTSSGVITPESLVVHGQTWTVYAVSGSPAQAVLHAILEIMPQRPDLVVSGINYGENIGTGVTVSGTVGAALEAAALGVRSLAVSLETQQQYHLSYSREIDFAAAAQFTAKFARFLLDNSLPEDVNLLKVEVPSDATAETPWEMTRLTRQRYYDPLKPERDSWDVPAPVGYREALRLEKEPDGTDAFVVRKKRRVSVTPLSLDLTSRVDLAALERSMRE